MTFPPTPQGKPDEAQEALEAMATLADDFGLPLGTTVAQVANHARFLQQERARLLLSETRDNAAQAPAVTGSSGATLEGTPAAAPRRKGKYRLVYNKVTKQIDKVSNVDGLVAESFDPPEDCA